MTVIPDAGIAPQYVVWLNDEERAISVRWFRASVSDPWRVTAVTFHGEPSADRFRISLSDLPTPYDKEPDWQPRSPAETPNEFYVRVAQTFMDLEAFKPQGPTKALGELAGVPFTTAVNWVRECRNRGLLSPSRRQLALSGRP